MEDIACAKRKLREDIRFCFIDNDFARVGDDLERTLRGDDAREGAELHVAEDRAERRAHLAVNIVLRVDGRSYERDIVLNNDMRATHGGVQMRITAVGAAKALDAKESAICNEAPGHGDTHLEEIGAHRDIDRVSHVVSHLANQTVAPNRAVEQIKRNEDEQTKEMKN